MIKVILISLLLVCLSFARIFNRCDLANVLKWKHNLSTKEIAIWVCIAQRQSGFDSAAIGYDGDGIGYHGLFQISDQYWCSRSGKVGNDGSNVCRIPCDRLRNDDLTDDFQCIRTIFDEHERISGVGYNAWVAYKNHCDKITESSITDCLSVKTNNEVNDFDSKLIDTIDRDFSINKGKGKIYTKCELARDLKFNYHIPTEQIPTWVCIAKHESNFDTSAIGRLNADGSEDHGLFQISDIYWCSPPGKGKGCGEPCSKFEDSDITDDVKCIKKIFNEHQRLSGNGFNAWAVYRPYCKTVSSAFTDECFSDNDSTDEKPYEHKPGIYAPTPNHDWSKKAKSNSEVGKVYDRCELAKELRYQHNLPEDQIATWVCIAKHESSYNTSAIGRLNWDGSWDHGLFQISDIYWCSPPGKGWACGVTCEQLRDNDLTDDVECIKMIHEEHTRLSGDGFNAWAVYNPYCKGRSSHYTDGCFNDAKAVEIKPERTFTLASPKKQHKGKVFERCELANELRFKHKIPLEQIANWVCIAKYHSEYNTSAVKTAEAGYHGIFQIGDIFWCSPPGMGWACGVSCDKLEDSDITDDVECIKKIYVEHQSLSGDGFNAWSAYNTHCKGRSDSLISDCFDDLYQSNPNFSKNKPKPELLSKNKPKSSSSKNVPTAKVYERCELARELRYKYNLPEDQIATWVCIAKHESSYNTSAIGRLNGDGSWDHGLFQISDIYWCSPPGKGWACGVTCEQLRDNDLNDDIECIKTIHAEHTRLSGDGFNAWAVYNPYCKGRSSHYTNDCFNDVDVDTVKYVEIKSEFTTTISPIQKKSKGKVFERCELANELRFKHKIPLEQIANWVCIAKYHSEYNTSAVKIAEAGYHGLFQIGDIFWCSPPGMGWACGLSCDKLEDSDITDDVECIKKIYEEHQSLSGDGFNAWSAYNAHCKGRSDSLISDCFDDLYQSKSELPKNKQKSDLSKNKSKISSSKNVPTGKVYERCELARELRYKYNLPEDQIATWVCIAKHESSYNTSAIGRLNWDGSWDHGLFQISDIYWCSPPGKGWACGVACEQLRDNDISDDIECIKTIYEEHTRLSGDGFNAWAVYKPHCKGKSLSYTKGCFDDDNLNDKKTKTSTKKSTQNSQSFTPKVIKTTISSAPSIPSYDELFSQKPKQDFSTLKQSTFPTKYPLHTTTSPSTTYVSPSYITKTTQLENTNQNSPVESSDQATTKRSTSIFEFYLNGFKTTKLSTIKWLFTTTPKSTSTNGDSSTSTPYLNTKNLSSQSNIQTDRQKSTINTDNKINKSTTKPAFINSDGTSTRIPQKNVSKANLSKTLNLNHSTTKVISSVKSTTNPFDAFKFKNPFIDQYSTTTRQNNFNSYFGSTTTRPSFDRTLKSNNFPFKNSKQQFPTTIGDQRPRSSTTNQFVHQLFNYESTTSSPTAAIRHATADRSNKFIITKAKSDDIKKLVKTSPTSLSSSPSTATISPTKRSIFDLYFDLYKH